MPITSSAKKALRASKRKRVFNVRSKKEMDGTLLSFRKLIVAKDKTAATKLLPDLYQALDKSAKTGYIKDNAAARLKSRAAASLAKLG
ncbi:MAG: 30S ribosomal protein S20 [Candidatus Taylorbacteria bacterium]|nr:30S ribosomal protein S20 [Candidatus Taylorbacteria bacterium]